MKDLVQQARDLVRKQFPEAWAAFLGGSAAAEAVAAKAQAVLDAGPTPRNEQELNALRYGLTDAYDDLRDTADECEQLTVAGVVVEMAADLLCELRGRWIGRSKWLPRRLHEAGSELGPRLMEAWRILARHADAAPLLDFVSELLHEAAHYAKASARPRLRTPSPEFPPTPPSPSPAVFAPYPALLPTLSSPDSPPGK